VAFRDGGSSWAGKEAFRDPPKTRIAMVSQPPLNQWPIKLPFILQKELVLERKYTSVLCPTYVKTQKARLVTRAGQWLEDFVGEFTWSWGWDF
jgi:hypothetical protein